MSDGSAMVANPWRDALVTLKSDIECDMHDLMGLLKKASADIGDRRSWAGPAAESWHADIEGRRQAMLAHLAKLLPAVQAEINRAPEKVTASEARMMRADLRGY